MPKYVSGNGGYVEVSVAGSDTWTRLNVATWTTTRGKRLAENTHSGTQGSSSYKRIVRDNTWRLEFPWDEDQDEIYETWDAAEFLHIRFKYGESTIVLQLQDTTLETFETMDNNATDIVRCVLSGKGGILQL